MYSQVLHDLGYDVSGMAAPVRPLKYHGKAVRNIALATSQEESRSRKERDAKVKLLHRKLDMTIVQASCVQDTINQIKDSCEKNKMINKNLLPKLGAQVAKFSEISGRDDSDTVSQVGSLPAPVSTIPAGFVQKDGMLMLKDASSACPVRFRPSVTNYGRGFEREKAVTHSKNAWSKEERERLNELYLEAEKPASNHPSSWNGFYKNLARLFCVYFPARREIEVMKKLHSLLCKHALIESGEREHWENFRKNNKDD
jgi:hypothetical protein